MFFFFFNDTATTEIYTLSLHDALPISMGQKRSVKQVVVPTETTSEMKDGQKVTVEKRTMPGYVLVNMDLNEGSWTVVKGTPGDRKSTRLNSSHANISYAVFCLKKKNIKNSVI